MATDPEQKKNTAAQTAARRKSSKRKKRRQRRALLLSAVFLLASVGLLIWAISLLKGNMGGGSGSDPAASSSPSQGVDAKLPANAVINDIAVGGKTAAEVRSLVDDGLKAQLSQYSVTLKNDLLGTKELSAEDMGLSFDADAALKQAQAGGKITVHPVID